MGKLLWRRLCSMPLTTAGFQGRIDGCLTEILALTGITNQLAELLHSFEVNVALLTGSTKTKERQQILTDLKSGELDIIIGTHALIQDEELILRI